MPIQPRPVFRLRDGRRPRRATRCGVHDEVVVALLRVDRVRPVLDLRDVLAQEVDDVLEEPGHEVVGQVFGVAPVEGVGAVGQHVVVVGLVLDRVHVGQRRPDVLVQQAEQVRVFEDRQALAVPAPQRGPRVAPLRLQQDPRQRRAVRRLPWIRVHRVQHRREQADDVDLEAVLDVLGQRPDRVRERVPGVDRRHELALFVLHLRSLAGEEGLLEQAEGEVVRRGVLVGDLERQVVGQRQVRVGHPERPAEHRVEPHPLVDLQAQVASFGGPRDPLGHLDVDDVADVRAVALAGPDAVGVDQEVLDEEPALAVGDVVEQRFDGAGEVAALLVRAQRVDQLLVPPQPRRLARQRAAQVLVLDQQGHREVQAALAPPVLGEVGVEDFLVEVLPQWCG